ncbi:unnamed protein product [Paramecium pentaurelia]|uniref:Uncharacterized protein n=1 Tax=Paramecium pentaurelia TaxID=43138 RepID=A0A8S1SAV1_9CILI|nr:unnamed protein product [Paramecium pentaurelia]
MGRSDYCQLIVRILLWMSISIMSKTFQNSTEAGVFGVMSEFDCIDKIHQKQQEQLLDSKLCYKDRDVYKIVKQRGQQKNDIYVKSRLRQMNMIMTHLHRQYAFPLFIMEKDIKRLNGRIFY